MKNQLFTYFILFCCVFAWGSNFIFGAILVNVFAPSVIAFIRLIFIVLFLWSITYREVRNYRLSKKGLLILVVAGLIGITLNQWSFYASLQYSEPVKAALILALSPIMTAILSVVFFKERKKKVFWFGSLAALLGVWLVITNGSFVTIHFGKGELLITLTMLSFSIFLIFVQQLSKSMPTGVITFYSNIFGLIGLLPFVQWKYMEQALTVSLSYWLLLIVTAIIMHGLCTYLWNNSIQKVGASNASLLMNLEPFIAMVVGLIVLGTPIEIVQLLGGIVIVCGVTISLRTKKTLL
ncbi:DMT family transporter [Viridibacillus sp. FSL R5-0477]|uniref:Transport protein n=1 Tax=Viridibacillus arenosi FSL R5-213 TaxID=1227360 RepID=W4F3J6_9BACL|nr:DMT family transporter [Viridibacillus arenosi]ETT87423.1 transport protein [Viridibacillus arenosi FSL R5-213]OMC91307.1 EamA family transporter [Viridibacillus arenosi]